LGLKAYRDLNTNLIALFVGQMFRIWPTTTADALVGDGAAGKIVGFVTFHCVASNHAKPGWKCTELVIVGATTSYYSVLM
jgi:hypothetical protein